MLSDILIEDDVLLAAAYGVLQTVHGVAVSS